MWCECYISTDGSVASQTCGDRSVNIPRRQVVELSSCRLEQQLLPMCQHGLPLWRATLKRLPMSGRDGKLEIIVHLPAARLAPRSAQGRIRSRVRRRNPRYHMHPGLVRYLQLSALIFYWMSASSNETVCLDTWIIKAIPTTFLCSSSSRTCPSGANSSSCWKSSNYGCHKGTVNRLGAIWTFWWRHGGDWESRTYVHAIKKNKIGSQLYSVSPVIDLPAVDILWQPEYSTKVPVGFKLFAFWWWFYWLLEIFRLKIVNSSSKTWGAVCTKFLCYVGKKLGQSCPAGVWMCTKGTVISDIYVGCNLTFDQGPNPLWGR